MSGSSGLSQQPDITPYSKLSDLEAIGQGGFGRVYKARHSDWGPIAYKELAVRFISHTDRVASELRQEVSVHIQLRHPNIVMIMAMVFESEHYGVILEFAAYGDIYIFLSQYPVDWAWKMSLAYDIALGMNYLHTQPNRALIHGDLKVKNILVGDGYKAKISDFGLARWKQYSSEMSHAGNPGGTVTHIPPESWKNINCRRSEKYDVYGYGVLIWELLAHPRRPFASVDSAEIKASVLRGHRPAFSDFSADIPQFMTSIIDQCWAQDAENRPMFNVVKDKLLTHMNGYKSQVDTARAKLQHLEYQRMQPQTSADLRSMVRSTAGPVSGSVSGVLGGVDGINLAGNDVRTSSFGPREVADDGLSFRGPLSRASFNMAGGAVAAVDWRQQGAAASAAGGAGATDGSMHGVLGLHQTAGASFDIGHTIHTNPGPIQAADYSQSLRSLQSVQPGVATGDWSAMPLGYQWSDRFSAGGAGLASGLSTVSEAESMDTESDTLTQPSDNTASLSTPLTSGHHDNMAAVLHATPHTAANAVPEVTMRDSSH